MCVCRSIWATYVWQCSNMCVSVQKCVYVGVTVWHGDLMCAMFWVCACGTVQASV